MNNNLTLKEKQILWVVLNNAQAQGLHSTGQLLQQHKDNEESNMVNDWLRQTAEEYDVINTLKYKLCGDLK